MSLTSNGLFSPMNRFGIHKNILLAYSPDYANPEKVECYVPTRTEVFKMPMAKLKPILLNWFSNAPTELEPAKDQKQAVIKLLKSRYDTAEIAEDIRELESLV